MSRHASRRSPAALGAGLLALAGVAFLLGLWVGRRTTPAPAPGGSPPPATGERSDGPGERPAPPGAEAGAGEQAGVVSSPGPGAGAPPGPAGEGKRIGLVIDDLGRSLAELDELASLGIPLSYAVLPYEPLTAEVTSELHRRDAEILCHLPMEPANGADPGPGALAASMSPERLAAAARQALAAVPGAAGANNHMGSDVTADPRAMTAILGVLGAEGMFWVDSRTSADSVGYRLALEKGIPAAERQVFLDGEPGQGEIREQFDRLLASARERGAAIAIAHPHPATLAVLREEVPEAVAAGYEFVPVSFLLDRTDVAPQ